MLPKTLTAILATSLGCVAAAVSSVASAQNIVQSDRINIAAVVKVGGRPVNVTQNGQYNFAGIVQAGNSPKGSILQNGSVVNSGSISQIGNNLNSSITQNGVGGAKNFASISQSSNSIGGGLRRR